MKATHCDRCGNKFESPNNGPASMGTGYAVVREEGKEDKHLCYDCCDNDQREEMKDRSRAYTCYLSCDGKSVSTWSGGELGKVISKSQIKHAFGRSYSHNGKVRWAINIRDVHGKLWYGRAYSGCVVNLRPMKG